MEKKTCNALLMNNTIFWVMVDVKEIKNAKVKELAILKISDVLEKVAAKPL